MSESKYFANPSSPDRQYEFGDAKLRALSETAERLRIAIESLRENLGELEEMKGSGETEINGVDIDKEIQRHKDALALSEERLGNSDSAIEYWDGELKKIATDILNEFTPREDQRPN